MNFKSILHGMTDWVKNGHSIGLFVDDHKLEKSGLMTMIEMLIVENVVIKEECSRLHTDLATERAVKKECTKRLEEYGKRLKEYENLWYNKLYVYLRSIRIRNPFFVK